MTQEQNSQDDLFEHYRIKVDRGQTSYRIDKFLCDRIERTSRTRIQNGIRAGAILVDGQQVKPNYKIKPGDEIIVVLPQDPTLGEQVVPEEMNLDIVYEDAYLLVLNKPAGMVVHPGIGHYSGTLVNGLAYYLNREDLPVLEGNLADRPGLVHRIDKETSGLLVAGKDEYTLSKLAKQFYDHSITREYVAIVWGVPSLAQGKIHTRIGRHPRHRLLMTTFPLDEDAGKEAITHYKLLEDLYYVSLVQCTLETGRTHQIRVHMDYLGCPVFSDARYGGDRIVKGTVFSKYKQFVKNCFDLCPRQALHARTLGFVHPATGKDMLFEAPLPDDMQQLLDKWRGYLQYRKDHV